MKLFHILCMSVVMGATPATADLDLVGKYNAARDLAAFEQIGTATLTTDESGTVDIISGTVTAPDGTEIPYSALFMMCGDTPDCANLHVRHDFYATGGKDMLFEIIGEWKATGRSPWAGYAFDKIRLIEEAFGFVGTDSPNAFVIALFWQQNLIAFHEMTKDRAAR